ncbi:MAG: hypothetical protein J2P48_13525 [Alphaproteobacteria bacterium]|nr:hypothetical protein [Alphaproteobacteria bacterium]
MTGGPYLPLAGGTMTSPGSVTTPGTVTAPNFTVSGPAGSNFALYWFNNSPVINWHPQFWNTVDNASREWRYNTDQGTIADIAPWGRITARADIRSLGQFSGFVFQTQNNNTESWTWQAWEDRDAQNRRRWSRVALNNSSSGDLIHLLSDGRVWFGWGDHAGQLGGGVCINSPRADHRAELYFHVPGNDYWRVHAQNQSFEITPWDWGRARWDFPSLVLSVSENRNFSFNSLLVNPQRDPGWWNNPHTGEWQPQPAFRVANNHGQEVATFESAWNNQCNIRITAPNHRSYWLVSQAGSNTGQFWIWVQGTNLSTNLPFQIYANGQVGVHGGFVIGTSDPRTKEILGRYDTGLAAILALDPIRYRHNGKAFTPRDDDSVVRIGIDGAAIDKVLPETTTRISRKLDPDDLQEAEILNVNSGPVVWALVNAIKELKAELDELKAARR